MAKRTTAFRPPDNVPPKGRALWARDGLAAVVLTCAIVLAYLPALQAGFIWDDDDYVIRNTTLRSLEGLRRIWFEPRSIPQYYPLVHTTFWLEYRLWGLDPRGYHVVNVLLHATNAWLVWRVLRLLQVPGAYLAALLFGLHPVNVESVAWITERKNTLSGLFFLSSGYLFLSWLDAPNRGRRYWGAVASSVAALLSKTVTATLPVSLAVVAWARGRWRWSLLWRLVPFALLGAALATVTVVLERTHVGAVGPDWNLSFLQRLLIATRALWFYLGSLLFPVNLTFIYPRWRVDPHDAIAYLPLVAGLVVAAALVAGVRWWGRWPLVAAMYFVVSLGPALGFVNVYPMLYSFVADHYQYLACIGPLALAAGILTELGRQLSWPAAEASRAALRGVAAGALCAALAVLTWQQAQIYRDVETLWRDTLRKNPSAWMAHNNLGLLLLQRGELDAAERHFQAALQVKADDSFAMSNLGLVAAQRGELEAALNWFQRAVREDPRQAVAANNLGNTLAQLGELAEAEQAYREALRRETAYPEAWNNLGNVLALQGKYAEAAQAYEAALAWDPDYAAAYLNYARLAMQQRQPKLARELLERLRGRDPHNPELAEMLRSLSALAPQ